MKGRQRRTILAAGIVVCISCLLAGCALIDAIFGTSTNSGMAGQTVSVDAKKHFTKDLIYHEASGNATFKKDGTFQEDYFGQSCDNVIPPYCSARINSRYLFQHKSKS